MEYQRFYKKFLEILTLNYPKRSSVLKELAAHLRMDQKNLARRMRGETPFTMQEIVKICGLLNISLDALMGNLDTTVQPMKIYLQDLVNPKIPESFRSLLLGMEVTARNRESGRLFLCSNLIPNGFYSIYPEVSKFIYFIWAHSRYPDELKTIYDFRLSDEIADSIASYGIQARTVKNSTYLFHSEFIENISRYILFFYETELLPLEVAVTLVRELGQLLSEIEEAAIRGVWPGTDNQIDIYITPLALPNSILITESIFYKSAIIYAFFLDPIISLQSETFTEIHNLAYSLLQYAENISVSGKKKRIEFIKKQREDLTILSESLKLPGLKNEHI